MSKRGSRDSGDLRPTEADERMIRRPFAALQRVTKIAAAAGADAKDIAAARSWPMIWAVSVIRIRELTPLAELGWKVSNSRAKEDASKRDERDFQILWRAIELLRSRAPPRGLASKIRSDLKLDLSVKQINRILDKGMPILLKL